MRATLPPEYLFSWESQASQHPVTGPPGLEYRRERAYGLAFDMLTYRTDDGELVGILYYYPQDVPPWEKAGNVNVWVRKDHQRRGIGTALVHDAVQRWDINFEQQRYTPAGLRLAQRFTPPQETPDGSADEAAQQPR